jgi:hypothetical protein
MMVVNMPRVRVDLCERCAMTLRDLESNHGPDAMAKASGAILARCPKCSKQLPDELRVQLETGVQSTALKVES